MRTRKQELFSHGLANALLIPPGPALMRPLEDSAISLGQIAHLGNLVSGVQILTALFALFFMWEWLTTSFSMIGSLRVIVLAGSYGLVPRCTGVAKAKGEILLPFDKPPAQLVPRE